MISIFPLTTPTSARATDNVIGTVRFSGPAWVGTPESPWTRMGATRPLVSGDRLKTGPEGYMIADLGAHGSIVLHQDAELSSDRTAPAFAAERGKVAFHLASNSPVQIQANGAEIAATATATDGYVEYDDQGRATLVVETGRVTLTAAGEHSSIATGEHIVIAADKSDLDPVSDRKAAAAPAMQSAPDHSRRNRALIIGGVTAAVAGGIVAAAVSGGGGGGGGDSDPSGGLEY